MIKQMLTVAVLVLLVIAGCPPVSASASPSALVTSGLVASTGGTFVTVAPARLLDTRSGVGAVRAPVGSLGLVRVQVTGRGGVPMSGVSAVVLNVTVTAPTTPGNVVVFAGGGVRPATSNLNFLAGQTVPNLVVVPVGVDGTVSLFNFSPGTAELIADVAGYYRSGVVAAAGAFQSVAPARLLDTRSGVGAVRASVGSLGLVRVQVTGRGGVPVSGVSAVVLNVTVTAPTMQGNVVVFAGGGVRPATSNLNFLPGQTVPNLVVVPVGVDGTVSLFNFSPGTAQLIADVAGYYVSTHVTAFSWAAPVTVDARGGLDSVSCASASFCVAVASLGQAVRFNGTSWSAPVGIDAVGALTAVSCPTSTFCVAVGSSGQWVRFNGTSWSAPVRIDALNALTAVSCPTSTFCVAVGSAGGMVSFNGTSWTVPLVIDSGGPLTSVSCVSVTFCVAVDGTGRALRFNGSGWTVPVMVDANGGGLSGVSCPSTTFCMAVDYSGAALRFTGSGWTASVGIDAAGALTGVSCRSTAFCVAVDYSGAALLFGGTSWTAPSMIDPPAGALSAVACPLPTFCAAVDYSGRAVRGSVT